MNTVGKQMFFFQQPSDDFFADGFLKRNKISVDLAFLDGLHLFEFLPPGLHRDRKGDVEERCDRASRLLSDNGIHGHARIPQGDWTGDVWKTLQILQLYRPD